MPQVIQGYLVNTKPSDPTAESTYVSDVVPVATTQTIHYPSQYRSFAISAAIKNQDGTNACTFSVNGQPPISLASGSDQNINNQSIVSITVTSGALGTCDILAQVTPIYYTTERQRFSADRG
jgi:hypothetical protein